MSLRKGQPFEKDTDFFRAVRAHHLHPPSYATVNRERFNLKKNQKLNFNVVSIRKIVLSSYEIWALQSN